MKTIKAQPFKNNVTISGEVFSKDEYINYIPYPLAGFDIRSYRPQKDGEEPKYDEIRIIRFNDEQILDEIEIGTRVLIKGETQSRNFSNSHPIADELIQNAVDLYMNFFEEDSLPCLKQPNSRVKQPILWEKLMDLNLIDEIPADSLIRENGEKERSEIQMYIYRVNGNGEVFKETDHTAYEVIANEIEILSEEVDMETGDENSVVYHGRVSKSPIFDVVEGHQFSKITVQSFVKYFLPDERRFVFFNFFTWGNNAEIIFSEVDQGDILRLTGRIQSKVIEREVRLKKKTASGKTKRKKILLNETVREVSIETIAKVEQKA